MDDVVEIRPGGTEDVGALLALFDEAVAWLTARGQPDQWGAEPWSQQPNAVARVEGLAADGLWIAELGGEAVGALIVTGAPPYVEPAAEPEAYIMLLLTSRRHAGKRLGDRLIEKAVALAVDAGVDLVRVDCWAGAPDLIAWYERQGFTRSSTYALRGKTGQVFELRLAPGKDQTFRVGQYVELLLTIPDPGGGSIDSGTRAIVRAIDPEREDPYRVEFLWSERPTGTMAWLRAIDLDPA